MNEACGEGSKLFLLSSRLTCHDLVVWCVRKPGRPPSVKVNVTQFSTYLYLCMNINCVYICLDIYVCMNVCMYVFAIYCCVCVCVCVYMYICMRMFCACTFENICLLFCFAVFVAFQALTVYRARVPALH
jgi:hypothetical protein